jgi:ornithine decarboxylase
MSVPIPLNGYPNSAYAGHDDYFRRHRLPTPCLLMDLDVVFERYRQLREVLPDAEVFYAVKANADPDLLRHLVALGCGFDVASPGEIDACLDAGADPVLVSYGNTVKKASAIRYAHERGVRLFAFDSAEEVDKVAAAAPGSRVFCRVTIVTTGARWPISRKFGCPPETAVELYRRADKLGLSPYGVTFHVGSQQTVPGAWAEGIRVSGSVRDVLAADGIDLELLNLGGGLPAQYDERIPSLADYGAAIRAAVAETSGFPRLIIEPGRYLPGDAGMIRSEVVLVTERTEPVRRRWVYVDVGRYGGLVEVEADAIGYPLVATRAGEAVGDETEPMVLAGPTCDSTDVMYEESRRLLPVDLRPGDHVDFLAAGAYTTPYASVGFNGFPPMPTYCFNPATLGSPQEVSDDH